MFDTLNQYPPEYMGGSYRMSVGEVARLSTQTKLSRNCKECLVGFVKEQLPMSMTFDRLNPSSNVESRIQSIGGTAFRSFSDPNLCVACESNRIDNPFTNTTHTEVTDNLKDNEEVTDTKSPLVNKEFFSKLNSNFDKIGSGIRFKEDKELNFNQSLGLLNGLVELTLVDKIVLKEGNEQSVTCNIFMKTGAVVGFITNFINKSRKKQTMVNDIVSDKQKESELERHFAQKLTTKVSLNSPNGKGLLALEPELNKTASSDPTHKLFKLINTFKNKNHMQKTINELLSDFDGYLNYLNVNRKTVYAHNGNIIGFFPLGTTIQIYYTNYTKLGKKTVCSNDKQKIKKTVETNREPKTESEAFFKENLSINIYHHTSKMLEVAGLVKTVNHEAHKDLSHPLNTILRSYTSKHALTTVTRLITKDLNFYVKFFKETKPEVYVMGKQMLIFLLEEDKIKIYYSDKKAFRLHNLKLKGVVSGNK